MKIQRIIPVMLGAAICLTGCGKQNDLNIQKDAVPVIPLETAVSGTTESNSESNQTTANGTKTSARQTAVVKTETSSVTGTAASAAGTAETAETQSSKRSSADSSGSSLSATGMLYGKWETVSFSKESGERISYDLSNPVHRSYYIGLDLNEFGQSSLTVGTETYPATTSMHDSILTVDTVSRNDPVTVVLTVSADRTKMTAELMNGRIIATLKRISRDFSIRDFLNAKPAQDAAPLIGEWYYLTPDQQVGTLLEIQADGSFTETDIYSNFLTTGTVKAEDDGYAFYDSENHLYLRFTPDPLMPNTYQDDKPEDGMLVRVEDYEQPNDWGYYDPVIVPVSSISVAALYGIWKNADGSGEMLEIYEGRTIYHGRFELTGADGKTVNGAVRLQYMRSQSGEKNYCFTFYTDGGEIPFALKASDTIQLTDLYGYPSDTPHYIRQE